MGGGGGGGRAWCIYIHMFGRLKLVKAPLLSPLLLVFVPIPWRPAQDTVDGKAARSSYKKLALKARLKTVATGLHLLMFCLCITLW